MNRDEGVHCLPWLYDSFFVMIRESGGKSRKMSESLNNDMSTVYTDRISQHQII